MDTTLLLAAVEVEYTPIINFAMQQNHVPVVRNLLIANNTETDWRNVKLDIAFEPEFALPWSTRIESLAIGSKVELGAIDIMLSTKFHSEITERISGSIKLTLSSDEGTHFEQAYKIDILAYDEWGGMNVLPEMLAAFVTPNHPETAQIIRRASDILEKWTGNPSFDEYQTKNPDRAQKQMAALYEAISERQIIYCSVPASFETYGQRVRTLDVVLGQQLGNCLDVTLLYASCIEAVGLRPILVVIKGHAFVGAWLIDEAFADSINDDQSLLTKRVADGINEIAVLEATSMNAGKAITFDEALVLGNNHLTKEDDFLFFIDVKRARYGGIRPIPMRIKTADGWEIQRPAVEERNGQSPTEIREGIKLQYVANIDVSRQKLWERKLLDLSLRNNLLNLRITKSTVQIIAPNLGKLEDGLSSGTEYQLFPKPADWNNPLRSAGIYQAINQTDPIVDLVRQELTQKRLRSYLTEIELASSVVNLYRTSRVALEENGANVLYVALGMLKWYETPQSERPRYAPLILFPVEIVRKSAQKGYVIRSREEEPIMNITLLEMMRQDFGINIGGLEVLPKDESGVDVRVVFSIVRQAIMEHSRWDIEEQAILGTFSFSKFVMWNDIHSNAEKLAKNKVVASLISGKLEWQTPEGVARNFDKQFHPSNIILPISADSSQLEAIISASEGNSFILHGPPGTGKSQTITNIIANAIYKGKKVLFVAEKMAALSVVESRLDKIGLGSFCLELHSNKAKKSAVLEQLKKTTEVARTKPSADFAFEADRLQSLRAELNNHVEALHKVYPFGLSLYDAFTGYSENTMLPDSIAFSHEQIGQLTKNKITEWTDLVSELQAAGTLCRNPHQHPLERIRNSHYNPNVKNEATALLTAYTQALLKLQGTLEGANAALKLALTVDSETQLGQVAKLSGLLMQLPNVPTTLITADNFENTLLQIAAIAEQGKLRDEYRAGLLADFSNDILTMDAEKTLQDWRIADNQWFLPKLLKQHSINKRLKLLSKQGASDKAQVAQVLGLVIQYQEKQRIIDANTHLLAGSLGFMWNGGNADWATIIKATDVLVKMNLEGNLLFKDPSATRHWRATLADALRDGTTTYLSVHSQALLAFENDYSAAKDKEASIANLLGVDFVPIFAEKENRITTCANYANQWLANIDGLRDWASYLLAREKAVQAGLMPVIEPYESGKLRTSHVIPSFYKGLYRSCAEYIFQEAPALASFSGQIFEEKIRRFRELSKNFEQLTKDEVYASLASRLPSFTQEAAQSSEIGILQRAIRNGGRGLSLRKLFDSIPNLLPRMCPCMLMSPISVAQYFEAGTEKFDLVIFDEASQMPTCDAVGAIARGSNVIVVGDPKQMPPTNFFSTQQVDEDNLDKEDLESILDDCLALSMPSRYLLWHYRSKHESLIAFSNTKYYDNKLLTFPSPDDLTNKVTYTQIEGYYDRGKTKQNKAEGEAIVKEVIRRLKHPELSKQSIGIVTFSSVQQILIDDMLTDVFKTHPHYEQLLLESAEPLFIKNLENVQGDERDVILFSVGYGPDREGKVALNFGPLNREGGWRRLNVAVSRARYEMKVYSTLRADQIDLSRTAAEGVAGLKAFLEYAEKGKAIFEAKTRTAPIKTNALIEHIATRIKSLGYKVHTNIGSSGYRLDIGIVNKDNPDEYILGILCDGENYRAAKIAKDREIVQIEVLKLLGWNILQIWSVEWWENPERIMLQLQDAIATIQNKGQLETMTGQIVIPQGLQQDGQDAEVELEVVELDNTEYAPLSSYQYSVYQVAQFVNQVPVIFNSDEFLQHRHKPLITEHVKRVVEAEGPINKGLLLKRILSHWGIARSGSRINAHFDEIFQTLQLKFTEGGKDVVLWGRYQSPEHYTDFRVHADDATKREADELPIEEIANAVKQILTNQISLPKDDLVREVSRLFGFSRIGNTVVAAMQRGMQLSIKRGDAYESQDRIILK
jgi:hypothetical protein